MWPGGVSIKGALVRAFFTSIGWMFLRLLLGLPAWALANAAVHPWLSYTNTHFMPSLVPAIGKEWALIVTVCPFLGAMLGLWVATLKLAERVFHFRFPD